MEITWKITLPGMLVHNIAQITYFGIYWNPNGYSTNKV